MYRRVCITPGAGVLDAGVLYYRGLRVLQLGPLDGTAVAVRRMLPGRAGAAVVADGGMTARCAAFPIPEEISRAAEV
jgi:hypothetical protein